MSGSRLVSCGASGVSEKQLEWVELAPGTEPSTGALLAILGGGQGAAGLLVTLEADGLIAEHATPEAAICHVVEGNGTVFLADGTEVSFRKGDTIEFAGDVPHGWRGGSERTLLAITTHLEESEPG